MEIMKASHQWASRPADERYWNLADLYTATKAHREAATTSTVKIADLRVETVSENIQLVGRTGVPAEITHFAFAQLAARAGAPASYLRDLPATLACQNLNYGLKRRAAEEPGAEAKLLLHRNGGFYARAITSDRYTRIWNYSIIERLLGLEIHGWKTPPARPAEPGSGNTRIATAADAALSLTVREGDTIGPAGLYASFEDLFVFQVHPERIIRDGSEGGLMRGFLLWNSEVGKSTFGVMSFLLRGCCGNHIIWNASEVAELRLRHVGSADERAFAGLDVELRKYADESAVETEGKILAARNFILKGKTVDDVLDVVFSAKILSRKTALQAYESVVPEEDGDPYTAWGYAQGITRLSQRAQNADVRVELDRAAGKVLELAF